MLQKVESTSISHNKIFDLLLVLPYHHNLPRNKSENTGLRLAKERHSSARALLWAWKEKQTWWNQKWKRKLRTISFEKQLKKSKSLLLLFSIILACRVKDKARVKCKIQTMTNSNSRLAVEEIRQWQTFKKYFSACELFWQREAKKIQSEQRYRSWQLNAAILKVLTWQASVLLKSNKGDILYITL